MTAKIERIEVENVNTPGKTTKVDAVKYAAMKKAFLKILPKTTPGLTQNEIREQVKVHLPQSVFPKGATAGWWAKTVQLDLEAKAVVSRETCKPLRWYRS